MSIVRIISGGQTGADRAALDVALRHGFPHGGWCPKGRKAEDGVIGGQYRLRETPSARYIERTERNVQDSDGTIVLTLGNEISGGSLRTVEFCQKHGKPYLHIAPHAGRYDDPALRAQRFVEEHQVKVLNVAGSRESEEPGIWRWAYQVIEDAFFWGQAHPNMLGGPGEG